MEVVLPMLYPEDWLNEKSEITGDGKTNREVARDVCRPLDA